MPFHTTDIFLVPKEITKLKKLRWLNFSKNPNFDFKSFPPELYKTVDVLIGYL